MAFLVVAAVAMLTRSSGSFSEISGMSIANATATSATTAAEMRTLALNPVADSYIDSENQDRNYGSVATLRIDGSPSKRAYLMFDLSGVGGKVEQVILRIYAVTRIPAPYELRQATHSGWEERTLTFVNAPQPGDVLALGYSVPTGFWSEVDLTNHVPLDGSFTLVVSTNSQTQAALASKESANPPELLVTFAAQTESGLQPAEPEALLGSPGPPQQVLAATSEPVEVLSVGPSAPRPEVTTEPEPDASISPGSEYVVQLGDTLSSISAKYGILLDLLIEANNLTNDFIVEGQVLLIPDSP